MVREKELERRQSVRKRVREIAKNECLLGKQTVRKISRE